MDRVFEKAIFEACLKSAVAMGPRIKKLSWFGKNQSVSAATEKEAA